MPTQPTSTWRALAALVVAAVGLVAAAPQGQRGAPEPSAITALARPLQLVVKVRTDADATPAAVAALGGVPDATTVSPLFPDMVAIGRRSATRRPDREARAPDGGADDALALEAGFARTFLVRFDDGTALEAALARYRRDAAVEYVERDALATAQWTPNDPYLATSGSWGQPHRDLYGPHLVEALEAWDVTRGAGVIVAVVDTGVDATHPDLDANLWTNPGEIPGNGVDDDGNGFVDDVHGWDFVYGRLEPRDGHGHGTHVAGIVAAEADNAQGIVGLAPESRVMAVKVLSDGGSGTYVVGASGILYAIANGADVVNASWGGPSPSRLLDDVVRYARSRGVLVVTSAGNDGLDASDFAPASAVGAVTVGGSDHQDRFAATANHGPSVDVTAPGEGVLSLRAVGTDAYGGGTHIVGERYYWASGTSMAAAYVSGAFALMLARFPTDRIDAIRDRLVFSADDLGAGNPERLGAMGGGRLNLARALEIALAPPSLALGGRVVDRNGQPMAGITVELGEMGSQRTVTRTDGRYDFANLRSGGRYTTRASQAGVDVAPATYAYRPLLASAANENVVGVRRWLLDPVDLTWASGFHGVSMALDAHGRPRIAYHAAEPRELRYAAWTGQAWTIEVVEAPAPPTSTTVGIASSLALDAVGRPHVVYLQDAVGTSRLRYARREPTGWQIEDVPGTAPSSRQPRLLLDTAGRPHVVDAHIEPTWGIVHAVRDGGGWQEETIVGDPFAYLTDATIDRQDRVHVTYRSFFTWPTTGAGFWHAVREGPGWRHALVDHERFAGLPADLAIDAAGQPRLVYGYWESFGANPSVKYATWDGAHWQIAIVEPGIHPVGVSLTASTPGRSVAAYDSSRAGLMSAILMPDGGQRRLIHRGKIGSFNAIAEDAGGTVHLTYNDGHTGYLWHARSLQLTDPAWTPPVVAITAPTQGSTIAGVVAVRVGAGSPVGLRRVEILIDGTLYAVAATTPYAVEWDTRTGANGVHQLTARAVDAAGVASTHTIAVKVLNPVPGDQTAARPSDRVGARRPAASDGTRLR